jgi:hypothetical protein
MAGGTSRAGASSATRAGRTNAAKTKTDRKPGTPSASGFRAKVRMYRQGLGDCHLIRLPRANGAGRDYFIMIDCGVILGTPEPRDKMMPVVEDIMKTTGGRVDVLIATHEHWDHLSGFIQARDAFSGFKADEIWLAWTEDPHDPLATKLRRERSQALAALALGVSHLHLGADSAAAGDLAGIMEFFGAGRGGTTGDALEVVRSFNPQNVRYRRPTDQPDQPPELGGVRFFVMGPPADEKLLKRTNPSKANHEGFGLALANMAEQIEPALNGGAAGPFDPIYSIPVEVASEMDFFKARYWDTRNTGEGWRRIDTSWLAGSEELALQLDNMTNNTSLVLAIELPGGDVLLFVADAQVGNWLSWQDLSWTVGAATVSGPDLLERSIFYKVGHHGSHNATLRAKGLDMMPNLQIAFVPVDHAMAVKKRWNDMPLPDIVSELRSKTNDRVFAADMPDEAASAPNVQVTPLFIEATF